jgi:hypothetical protein
MCHVNAKPQKFSATDGRKYWPLWMIVLDSKAKTIPYGHQVTAVSTLSLIASFTTDTGRADPPQIADRLPVPRESQSRTQTYILLSASAPQLNQGLAL